MNGKESMATLTQSALAISVVSYAATVWMKPGPFLKSVVVIGPCGRFGSGCCNVDNQQANSTRLDASVSRSCDASARFLNRQADLDLAMWFINDQRGVVVELN